MFFLQFLSIQKLLIELAKNYEPTLIYINQQLNKQGYPDFFLGGIAFLEDYRVDQKPRFVAKWFPPDVSLNQFYVRYLPEDKEITIQF